MMGRDANPKFVRLNRFFYVSGVLFKSVCFNFFVLDLVELLIKIVMVSFLASVKTKTFVSNKRHWQEAWR